MTDHASAASAAAFERAVCLGYCHIIAHAFGRKARRDVRPGETAKEVALRIVPPKFMTLGELT